MHFHCEKLPLARNQKWRGSVNDPMWAEYIKRTGFENLTGGLTPLNPRPLAPCYKLWLCQAPSQGTHSPPKKLFTSGASCKKIFGGLAAHHLGGNNG